MSILKYRLNRKNSSGSYDVIHYESSSNIILRPDSTTVEQGLQSLEIETETLKTSVSEGKSLIAAAVTDKGVTTAADDTFQQMATNISSIFQLDTSDATASTYQILYGYTAYVDGQKITGSMANVGAVNRSLNCGASYNIPAGYHNGSGKVTANSLASQTSGTATAARILSGYTAWVNGTRITGTMQAGVSFTNPVCSFEGNSYGIDIPSNVRRCYVVYGGGYYWGVVRINDTTSSTITTILQNTYSDYRSPTYSPSSRYFEGTTGDELDGLVVIGWAS